MAPHFLTLPLEIRTMILKYLLGSPTGHIVLYASTSRKSTLANSFKIRPHNPAKPKSYRSARTISLAVLRTCRQLNQEALELIWKENIVTFRFNRPLYVDESSLTLKRMRNVRWWYNGLHLRHIELCALWLYSDNVEKTLSALNLIYHCALQKDNVLNSVTLVNVSVGRDDGWNMCEQLYIRRSRQDNYMVTTFFSKILDDLTGSLARIVVGHVLPLA